jgi:TonB family protein
MNTDPSKIKMMATPEITEAEIRKSMDFESVLERVNAAALKRRKITRLKTAGLSLLGLLVIVWGGIRVLTFQTSTPSPARSLPHQEHPIPKSLPGKVAPASSEKQHPGNSAKPITAGPTKKTSPPTAKIKADPEPANILPSYSEAEPVDGFAALYEYFDRELKYPPDALRDSVRGVLTVKFVIGTSGKPEQIKILNSLSPSCDKEALRLIENMPLWKPAMMNGRAVASNISIPLTFQFKQFHSR